MFTAMIKLPDGKVINKRLCNSLEELPEKIIDADNGCVSIMFDEVTYITHWANICIKVIKEDSQ